MRPYSQLTRSASGLKQMSRQENHRLLDLVRTDLPCQILHRTRSAMGQRSTEGRVTTEVHRHIT
ncbi:hypothetical protein DPMN_096574 [Dreissena polymorpha]|uniref:Uncharacterized protein n=1 Tax=Dreissena polymorpha TaxID=45954 RepID=A0A9D4L9N0_DREPO|nr:hypothetical protein DPMN_096574 [Dreissena polymorpha]